MAAPDPLHPIRVMLRARASAHDQHGRQEVSIVVLRTRFVGSTAFLLPLPTVGAARV